MLAAGCKPPAMAKKRRNHTGTRYCAARGCSNNKKRNKDMSFFRFPKDPVRSNLWAKSCGRMDLLKRDFSYRYDNCTLCSTHFEDTSFYSCLRNRLHENAVPAIFGPSDPKIPKLVEEKGKVGLDGASCHHNDCGSPLMAPVDADQCSTSVCNEDCENSSIPDSCSDKCITSIFHEDCDDDLCIFICGTCKRYFTQLSAFTRHKKERSCRRKPSNNVLANNMVVDNQSAEETPEEVETDDNPDGVDAHEIINNSTGEQFTETEAGYLNSQRRKYPRKQDKRNIKRTIRDLDPSDRPVFQEHAGLDDKPESDWEARADPVLSFRNPLGSIVPFSSRTPVGGLHDPTSEGVDQCNHPVYVCKRCHAEFPNIPNKPYKCIYCRRGFSTERELKEHIAHTKHDKLYEVGGKNVVGKYKQKKHALNHVAEGNFRCEAPSSRKAFNSTDDLKMRVTSAQSTEKHFTCARYPCAFSLPDRCKSRSFDDDASTRTLSIDGEVSRRAQFSTDEISGRIQSPVANGLQSTRPDSSLTVGQQNRLNAFDSNSCRLSKTSFSRSFKDELHSSSHQTLKNLTNASVENTSLKSTVYVVNGCAGRSSDSSGSQSRTSKGELLEGSQEPDCLGDVRSGDVSAMNSEHSVKTSSNTTALVAPKKPKANSDGMDGFKGGAPNLKLPLDVKLSTGKECERCKSHFLTSSELLAHRERRADHVLRCKLCSAKFLSNCELRLHETQSHAIVRGPKAGLGFTEAGGPGEVARQPDKHVCADCGKVFSRSDKLRRHAIIHSPDRPCIPCKYRDSHGCTLTFHRKDSMKRHALRHTCEKPYKCDICDKTFSRPDYLTKHVSSVHNKIFAYRCTLCDYGTRESKRLRIHIRSKHEMEAESLLSSLDAPCRLGLEERSELSTTTPLISLEDLANPGDCAPTGSLLLRRDIPPTSDMTMPDDMTTHENMTPPDEVIKPEVMTFTGIIASPGRKSEYSPSKHLRESSSAEECTSEYVGDLTVDRRSLSDVGREGAVQHCTLSAVVERLNPREPSLFYAQENTSVTGIIPNKGGLLNMRKTPLNS